MYTSIFEDADVVQLAVSEFKMIVLPAGICKSYGEFHEQGDDSISNHFPLMLKNFRNLLCKCFVLTCDCSYMFFVPRSVKFALRRFDPICECFRPSFFTPFYIRVLYSYRCVGVLYKFSRNLLAL